MDKQNYTVTQTAGPRVCGLANPGVNETLMFTEEQARYALISGELVPASKDKEAAKPKSKPDLMDR